MCGIAGIIDYNNKISNKEQKITYMSASLHRRGPDDDGYYISKPAFLAHRRLAVIDPENGAQPMTYIHGNKKYTIVYNGELYNSDDIRKELTANGIVFKTTSDTEVLLHSYILWQEKCLDKLNGIFAFAVFSEPDNILFIARDRLGVKPLFYSHHDDVFIFSSEIKGILSSGIIPPVIDKYSLAEVFLIGPGRTAGNGVYKHINELKPGHYAVYSKEKGLVISQYWRLSAKAHTEDHQETAEHLRMLVEDAVTRQLVSDVPVCTFLSGGLDSSIITALASKSILDLHSFSIGYAGNEKYFKANYFQPNSDDAYIGIMSRYCCSKHHMVILEIQELFDALTESTEARDLPGMADVDSSLLLFCKEIKKYATVALSGECADEIFGGYPWYHNKAIYSREGFPWSGPLDDRAQLLRNGILDGIDHKEYVLSKYHDTIKNTELTGDETPHEKRMREMFMLNIHWFMQTLLDRKDRMSMYSGLEVRVPFCDHRLVEYAYNIPWSIKAANGREKGILREAVTNLLPAEITERKKSPYPKTYHPLYMRLVKERLTDIMNDKKEPLGDIVNIDKIKTLIEKEDMFESPMYGQLMTLPQVFAYLIQVNYWLKKHNPAIL